jgi:hypothetical protein
MFLSFLRRPYKKQALKIIILRDAFAGVTMLRLESADQTVVRCECRLYEFRTPLIRQEMDMMANHLPLTLFFAESVCRPD